ncbi:hypothetical protein [Streptomyces sp. UH6]|uniref:hypothetical protein n=1 Tax=Streptomyces sp. UH6 TaxID=2748379 RepID=UPI0015D4C33A|nr:hypothetical protein [Streptomyces sp. UH6]NYV72989.1 hypothetical protein [Streptomyces sp. UH6]
MIVGYRHDDGTVEEVSAGDLSALEAQAVEEATGSAWQEIEQKLREKDPTAMRAIIWAGRRREDQALDFETFDLPQAGRRLRVGFERYEIDELLTATLENSLAKNEDQSLELAQQYLRNSAYHRADVDAALEALGKGHLARRPPESAS